MTLRNTKQKFILCYDITTTVIDKKIISWHYNTCQKKEKKLKYH